MEAKTKLENRLAHITSERDDCTSIRARQRLNREIRRIRRQLSEIHIYRKSEAHASL